MPTHVEHEHDPDGIHDLTLSSPELHAIPDTRARVLAQVLEAFGIQPDLIYDLEEKTVTVSLVDVVDGAPYRQLEGPADCAFEMLTELARRVGVRLGPDFR